MAKAGFVYTKGAPKYFRQTDLETPRTHEFCSGCGTHLQTRSLNLLDSVLHQGGNFRRPESLRWTRIGNPDYRHAIL